MSAAAEGWSPVVGRAAAIRPSSSRYRPDIDGLRAIAILAVLAYHAFGGRAPGGFVGVDIFFVISGYLITGILARRLDGGDFRLRAFYAARVRRIFPALILVLAAVLVAGWFTLLERPYEGLGRHVAASALFSANLIFWREINYFNVFSTQEPLIHLWSIGVEEQFYLAWPVLLLMSAKVRVPLFATAAAILLASFAWSVWLTGHDPAAAFYSPFSRAWELMLGAVIALRCPQLGERAATGLSLVGLFVVLAAFTFIEANDPFPGWRALVPCVGTGLLIAAGKNAAVNRLLLSRRELVAIGLISYPLYLWHYPLLSFTSIWEFAATPSRVARIGLLALSFVLAFATYRWVETSQKFRRRIGVPQLLAGMAVCFAAGVLVARTGVPGRPITGDPRRRFVERYSDFIRNDFGHFYWDECNFYDITDNRSRDGIAPTCTARGVSATIVLWGDSHAQMLSWGLRRSLPSAMGVAQITTSDCPPSLAHVRTTLGDSCDRSNAFALRTIARLRPDVVILAQRQDQDLTDWTAIARRARAEGARKVLLVGPAPEWMPSLPEVVAASTLPQVPTRVLAGLSQSSFNTDSVLSRRYSRSPDLTYVSLIAALCDRDGCIARVPGMHQEVLMAVDYGHLTPAGSDYVAKRILAPELHRLLEAAK